MCGIVAILNYRRDIKSEIHRITKMYKAIHNRGPDGYGIVCNHNYLLAHTRLAIVDVQNGHQPMQVIYQGIVYTIVYNGILYNYKELKKDLEQKGHLFDSNCDTEVVLRSYIEWKEDCLDKFNGIFAFVITHEQEAFIARDPFGVKPIYYSQKNDGEWLIASEVKSILAENSIRPILTKHAFATMISMGPSLPRGMTVYKNIYQLSAGHYIKINRLHHSICQYHKIACYSHKDSYDDTVNKVHSLLSTCIKNQCVSDVDICGMLSGGIDSSIICSVASREKNIKTYSLLLENNIKYFSANSFQPTLDQEYAKIMANYLNVDIQYVEVSQRDIALSLVDSMCARDMPAMADVDSSLLLFCKEIANKYKVVLTGECADEVFGGYPWFYKNDLMMRETFPWLNYLPNKIDLVNNHFSKLEYYEIRKEHYEKECSQIMYLDSDLEEDKLARKMTHLSIYYFMQTLLMRMDSMASFNGLEGRVPFADKDLIDYVFNIPWAMKYSNNQEKGILRDAFKKELPDAILERKKSPFPRTYNPEYTEIICNLLENELSSNDLLKYYFDEVKLIELIKNRASNFELPWFGQLMKGPQLIAYIYQFSKWLTMYNVIPE